MKVYLLLYKHETIYDCKIWAFFSIILLCISTRGCQIAHCAAFLQLFEYEKSVHWIENPFAELVCSILSSAQFGIQKEAPGEYEFIELFFHYRFFEGKKFTIIAFCFKAAFLLIFQEILCRAATKLWWEEEVLSRRTHTWNHDIVELEWT